MGFTRIRVVVAAGLLAVATVAAIGPAAGSAMAGTGVPERAVPVPGGQLFGVAATSARNAWAVGGVVNSGKTLILRWDGTAWARVPSPTPVGETELYAVAATSARNAWAVGGGGASPGKTIILHWNGTAWKTVPSPTPKGGGTLFGVAATSAGDAWAVGCAGNCFQGFGGIKTLILRWNGTAWMRMPSPAPARVGALNGVAATSASNAWAVGCAGHCFGPMATTTTMIVHWNGTAWRQVASPNPAPNSVLTAVTATSVGNAWAVGYTRTGFKTLIVHWNGAHWARVASPTPGPLSQLLGVAATSTRNAWAVGADEKGGILQRWNGKTWK